mmetsp:Transcript_39821/g.77407  ORF Transcript_39821/g.77407 Transcript_39821/m.77407 type:complete len:91 (-) Transcript_39821:635-907(-)
MSKKQKDREKTTRLHRGKALAKSFVECADSLLLEGLELAESSSCTTAELAARVEAGQLALDDKERVQRDSSSSLCEKGSHNLCAELLVFG